MATNQIAAQARGVVVILEGNAWIVKADGSRVAIKVGDEVQEGQQIVTADGTRLELALPNGQPVTIASGRELLIDANLLGTDPTDKSEAALTNLNSGADLIAKVLSTGGDLSVELDPTAAGNTGGDASDSHGFVRVLRISEEVSPLTISRDTNGLGTDQQDISSPDAVALNTATPSGPTPTAGPSVLVTNTDGATSALDNSVLEASSGVITGDVSFSAAAGI
jgi:hypothetical protein